MFKNKLLKALLFLIFSGSFVNAQTFSKQALVNSLSFNVSGTVFLDTDGGNVNGSGFTESAAVNLLNSSNEVLASTLINSNGTYTFTGVVPGTYKVALTANERTIGSTTTNPQGPLTYIYTGEYTGAVNTGNDGNVNGISEPITIVDSGVSNVNFGLQKDPEYLAAGTCKDGYSLIPFDWADYTWSSSDTQKTYPISYTDSFGNLHTFNVKLTKSDPDNVDFDSSFSCKMQASNCDPITTGTQSFFGGPYLSQAISTTTSDQEVTFTFEFEKPVRMSGFDVSDIDSQGDATSTTNGIPTTSTSENGFQDEVKFTASLNGTNVPLGLTIGSSLLVSGDQIVTAVYDNNSSQNYSPEDAAAEVKVTSQQDIDKFSWAYSNGPLDDGISNSHAVRTNGFNFCVQDPALISGVVQEDSNYDGNPDTTISGVTLKILNADGTAVVDYDGNPVSTTVTAFDGSYEFKNIPAGDYIIEQVDKLRYASVSDYDNTDPTDDAVNVDTNDNMIAVSVNPGEIDSGNNFVDFKVARISGTVFEDIDNDGVIDSGDASGTDVELQVVDGSGDTGIRNIEIQLLDASGNPVYDAYGDLVTNVFTDPNGDYAFENLLSGEYQLVQIKDPEGYESVIDVDGVDDNVISNITLVDELVNQDFLENLVAAKISGIIFIDNSANNNVDGEKVSSLDGVQLHVNLIDLSTGRIMASMPVFSDGKYEFLNLDAGDYGIQLADTPGIIGDAPAGSTLPTNWYNVGDTYTDGPVNGTADGTIEVVTAETGVENDGNNFAVGLNTLPVDFVSFEVVVDGKDAILYWSTLNEVNNDKFIIERSIDGSLYKEIGEVNGNGTTLSLSEYSFTDFGGIVGKTYYRLKQVDFDGSFEYSDTIVAIGDNTLITVYPNPVVNTLNVSNAPETSSFMIYDLTGQLIKSGSLNESIDVSGLLNGIYVIRIVNNKEELFTQKIFKK